MSDSPFASSEWKEFKFGDHVRLHYMGGEHAVLVREVMQPGGIAPRHRHDRTEELLIVTRGEIDVTIGDETRTLTSGEAVIVPRGEEHELATPKGADFFVTFCPANGQLPKDDYHLVDPENASARAREVAGL